jgi:hypothetical protein
MPSDVKLSGKPMQDRVSDRLKNSGAGAKPDVSVQKGEDQLVLTRTCISRHRRAARSRPRRASDDH